MPNLTRTTPRPTARPATAKPKMLLVRRPVKPVEQESESSRTNTRLLLGVIVALGTFALVWLMGELGYRIGFAPLVRVPELAGDPGSGLVTGVLMIISIPEVVITAGLEKTEWMMLSFLLIAIPAGGMAAIRPGTPGGPRMSQPGVVFAYGGAVAAGLVFIGLLWWTASSIRLGMLRELPMLAGEADQWITDLKAVAGLDVLFAAATAVWMVLVLRLPVPAWTKALSGTAAFFTMSVLIVAMSVSGASVAQVRSPRSVCLVNSFDDQPRLLIGATTRQTGMVSISDAGVVEVHLVNAPTTYSVIGRQSIVEFMQE